MTKQEIVDIVAEGTGLTKVDTLAVIDGFIATVAWALQHGQSVTLRGFGTFLVADRKARRARNPVTKKLVEIPPRKAPYFRPAEELRESVAKGPKAEQEAPATGTDGPTPALPNERTDI
ncbi:MAG: HU family DNA-binding protein [bacterium]|jgi:nucleoid DNA-binding protein|nr:HU family DNA-binding protein [candidate division KSB1 bacterium]MDH7560224.1 HU family DNA-binding protein [bacterium]